MSFESVSEWTFILIFLLLAAVPIMNTLFTTGIPGGFDPMASLTPEVRLVVGFIVPFIIIIAIVGFFLQLRNNGEAGI
jgi:hypothetical protein